MSETHYCFLCLIVLARKLFHTAKYNANPHKQERPVWLIR